VLLRLPSGNKALAYVKDSEGDQLRLEQDRKVYTVDASQAVDVEPGWHISEGYHNSHYDIVGLSGSGHTGSKFSPGEFVAAADGRVLLVSKLQRSTHLFSSSVMSTYHSMIQASSYTCSHACSKLLPWSAFWDTSLFVSYLYKLYIP
jgi:hypothetical protein